MDKKINVPETTATVQSTKNLNPIYDTKKEDGLQEDPITFLKNISSVIEKSSYEAHCMWKMLSVASENTDEEVRNILIGWNEQKALALHNALDQLAHIIVRL